MVGFKFLEIFNKRSAEVMSIDNDGFAKLPTGLRPTLLKIIDEKVTAAFSEPSYWNDIFLHCKGDSADKLGAKPHSPVSYLSNSAAASNYTNFISLKNPFLVCPELVEILREESIFKIITGYLGPRFALSGSNIRKSFVTDFEDADTNKWHVDGNAGKLLKLFIYLNDVTDSSHGPTEYIIGSHASKYRGWDASYRIPDQELRANYRDEDFIALTGKYGEVRFADTTGIHRGIKVVHKDRIMITLNFCTHTEFPLKSFKNDLICDFSSPLINKFRADYPTQSRLLVSN
jgi:hypothetical protein